MTIKKRLFLSNILMLIIPAIVSVVAVGAASFLFWNVFYRQYMDEAFEDSKRSQMYEVLVEQSKNFIHAYNDEDSDSYTSKSYTAMEEYLNSNNTRLDIYSGETLVCSIGTWYSEEDDRLLMAMQVIGNEGDIAVDDAMLHSEKVLVENTPYQIYFFSHQVKTSNQHNEAVFTSIVIILLLILVAAVLITNRFLTRFVFQKIEDPLAILGDGVHQIRDGNVDYRIAYTSNDEFLPVCNDFNDMAARLKKSVEDTDRNEISRKELIAGISHDIRTPLTSVRAYIEGLMEGVATTPEMKQKYMRIILSKANDMDAMVDKLFLFSKLDLGECPFYPEEFDAGESVRMLVEQASTDYASKGMILKIGAVTPQSVVYADPVQFKSAVTNIIENSLKYKVRETVTVWINCENVGTYINITIDDNGPGVPEEALSKLFDVFYRSDPSRNNPHKGSGLGLAITSKILEYSGGKIHAENLQPQGLRIVMQIPKKEREDECSES